MQLEFLRNPRFDRAIELLTPIVAVVLALLIGAVMLAALDADPVEAYQGMWDGAFGTKRAVSNTLVKSIPLMLVGVGICISFRGGVINIGGEGQMIAGGVAAITVGHYYPDADATFLISRCLIASFAAGAAWGGLAGALKAYFNVNEILSTIMLNQIAIYFARWIVLTEFLDPKQQSSANPIPESARMPSASDLPRMGERLNMWWDTLGLQGRHIEVFGVTLFRDDGMSWTITRLHYGIVIAIVLAVVVYILLWRTTVGYRIRAVGKNPQASRYAGIDVRWHVVLSLMLSGGLAGLAGGVTMLGSINHRMNVEEGAMSFTGNAGFNGIVAALFGGLHPIGTIPASILFGALLIGGGASQRTVQVPSSLITALIGLVIVFVVSSDIFIRRRAARRVAYERAEPPRIPQEAQGA